MRHVTHNCRQNKINVIYSSNSTVVHSFECGYLPIPIKIYYMRFIITHNWPIIYDCCQFSVCFLFFLFFFVSWLMAIPVWCHSERFHKPTTTKYMQSESENANRSTAKRMSPHLPTRHWHNNAGRLIAQSSPQRNVVIINKWCSGVLFAAMIERVVRVYVCVWAYSRQ